MKRFIVMMGLAVSVMAGNAESRLMTTWGENLDSENVWNVYPRPAMARDAWKNLNGKWQYAIVERGAETPRQWDGEILVPFAVESQLSGVGRRVGDDKELWYKRTFEVPVEWSDKNLILNFGAVDWRTTVWVNGKEVGSHTGGYTPFSFHITEALNGAGEPNEIVVRVYDPTDYGFQPRGKQVTEPEGIWYTPVTGIWQTVWIEPVESINIQQLKITPDVDNRILTVLPTVDVDSVAGLEITVDVIDNGKIIAQGKAQGENEIVIAMPEDMKLWTPDTPSVYDLEIKVTKDGKEVDAVKSYTAMRKYSMGRDETGTVRLQLNDKNIFHFGPLDQGWWPDGLYTAPSYEALIWDIDLAKKLGFNMIRKHIKTEPAVWYEYCDRAGIMVWQDMPSSERPGRWLRDYYDGEEMVRSLESARIHKQEWKDIIDYLYNEPCVAVWVPFNEAWGQFQTVDITNWTKAYDATRLVNPASGGNFFLCGDIVDVHHYPEPKMTMLRSSKANVLGEYGGIGLVTPGHMWDEDNNWGYVQYESGDEVTKVYLDYLEILRNLAGVAYTGAVYTQTTDVENEANGFATYDRKVVKVDVDRVAKGNRSIIEAFSAK